MIQTLVVVAVLSAAVDAGPIGDIAPVLSPKCSDNWLVRQSMATFCSRACQECGCQGAALQGTCADTCLLFWHQTAGCGTGVSFNVADFTPQWTADGHCAQRQVNKGEDKPSRDVCQWVCDCCESDDPNCVDSCQANFFPWFYDQVCWQMSNPGVPLPGFS